MAENHARTKQPLVLIAGDDAMSRHSLRDSLEKWSFEVVEARDGLEVLEIFECRQPDIAVLHASPPEVNGCQVCLALREHEQGKQTPVLIVVDDTDMESIDRAYGAGATDFITKPVTASLLAQRVRYLWRAIRAKDVRRRTAEGNRPVLWPLPDLLFRIDTDGIILSARIPDDCGLRISADNLVGKKTCETLFADIPEPAAKCLEQVRLTRESRTLQHQVREWSRKHHWETRFVCTDDDELFLVMRDATDRKRADERITRLAYHDPLTGLLNTHAFKEHFKQALAVAERHGRLVGAIRLDLDRFKRINDTLGHEAGNVVLQKTAERITHCTRRSDCSGRLAPDGMEDAVARVGGDEFTLFLTEVNNAQDVLKVARRVRDTISSPIIIEHHEVLITASIGITVYPMDGDDVETLLQNADKAMYHAKDQGRNNYQFYNPSLDATTGEQLALEYDLHKALHRGEFVLHYQPQVDLRTGKVVGVEALVRWHHPTMGIVPPLKFIPLAEEMGLMLPIGAWILRIACLQSSIWQKSGFGPIRMAVNLSSHQFRQSNLLQIVEKVLRTSGIDPQCLELEITETTAMGDAESTIRTLKALKGLGIRLSIDDFGTGYSSLSYLKRFPIDVLKIDRSFIMDIATDPDDAAITKSIIVLAHSLNLKVIAEGVETEEQRDFLRQNGCEEMQGYLFSPPVEPSLIPGLLRECNAC